MLHADHHLRDLPLPGGTDPNLPAAAFAKDPRAEAIAAAARELHAKREAWLNPPDLVRREPEVVPGYPDRLLPVDEAAARELKKRTLTNLYNRRPHWLAELHRALDAAVATACGRPADLGEEEVWRASSRSTSSAPEPAAEPAQPGGRFRYSSR